MKINNKDYEQIEAIAAENGLATRELTSGSNGYPKNLRLCITDFDTYEQAQDLADKYGGKVTSISRRDGWQLSQSEGCIYEAYDIHKWLLKDHESDSIEILRNNGTDVDEYLSVQKEIFKDLIDEAAADADAIRDIIEAIDKVCDIADEVESLDDDELLFVINGTTEVYKKYDTHYNHDVWTYDIAVEFPD